MNLAPLLETAPSVKIHLVAATAVILLGVTQFVAPKGSIPHRTIGWIWVALVVVIVVTGFVIRDQLHWGPFSTNVCVMASKTQTWMARCGAIHTLSVYALLAVPYAALHARRHNVNLHRWVMISVFIGAVVAGAFAFQAPRTLGIILFGQ